MSTEQSIELTDLLIEGRYRYLELGSSKPEDVVALFGSTDDADDRYAPNSAWFMDYRGLEFYFTEDLRLKTMKVTRPYYGITLPGSMGVDVQGSGDLEKELLLFGKPVDEIRRVTAGLAALPADFAGRVGGDPDGRSIHILLENGERSLSVNYVLESRRTSEHAFDVDYHFDAIRIHFRGGWG